jgi:hypothetical protein
MRDLKSLGRLALALGLFAVLAFLPRAVGAAGDDDETVVLEAAVDSATVEIDGTALFRVRGVSALPGHKRAALIADRIVSLARDPAFNTDDIAVVESDGHLAWAGAAGDDAGGRRRRSRECRRR